jgi:hypothetical protein
MSSIDISTRAIIGYSGSLLAILFLMTGFCIQLYQVTMCQQCSSNGTYSFEFKEDSEYNQQHLNQDHDPAELSPRSESYKNRSIVPRLISQGISFSHLAPDPDDFPDSDEEEGDNAV